MRDDESFFTPEELAAFREVDRQRAAEQEQVEPVSTVERIVPPAAAVTLTAEQSAGWNRWANELISAQCESVIKAVTKEFFNQETELRKELRTRFQGLDSELAALREETVKLRVELAYLRGLHGASDRTPIDLPAIPLQPKRNGLNG
jgi:hypothetical protein